MYIYIYIYLSTQNDEEHFYIYCVLAISYVSTICWRNLARNACIRQRKNIETLKEEIVRRLDSRHATVVRIREYGSQNANSAKQVQCTHDREVTSQKSPSHGEGTSKNNEAQGHHNARIICERVWSEPRPSSSEKIAPARGLSALRAPLCKLCKFEKNLNTKICIKY